MASEQVYGINCPSIVDTESQASKISIKYNTNFLRNRSSYLDNVRRSERKHKINLKKSIDSKNDKIVRGSSMLENY